MKQRSEWITTVVQITFFTVSINQDTRQRIWRRTTGTNIRFLTQVETFAVSFICLFTNANASTGWFIETLLTVRSVSAREKWYYFGSHGVANLKIDAKWETAEVVVGPTGKLAACQIHRKRTGIVSRFNFSFSAFLLRPSSRSSENRLFRLQIFESFSTRLPLIFLREFLTCRMRNKTFSNAFKYLDSSFRFDLMRFNVFSRLYRSISRIVCGLNFHGSHFIKAYSAFSQIPDFTIFAPQKPNDVLSCGFEV